MVYNLVGRVLNLSLVDSMAMQTVIAILQNKGVTLRRALEASIVGAIIIALGWIQSGISFIPDVLVQTGIVLFIGVIVLRGLEIAETIVCGYLVKHGVNVNLASVKSATEDIGMAALGQYAGAEVAGEPDDSASS